MGEWRLCQFGVNGTWDSEIQLDLTPSNFHFEGGGIKVALFGTLFLLVQGQRRVLHSSLSRKLTSISLL